MATVTGATKKEHDEREMAKRSGNKHDSDKPKFKFPHYKIGDIVRQDTGHMVVTEHDKKNQGYMGHSVDAYGETIMPKRESAVLHEDVRTGKHHLYASAGDYPTKEDM